MNMFLTLSITLFNSETIISTLMPTYTEKYPLLNRLNRSKEIFTAGVIFCIINLDTLPQGLIDYLNLSDIEKSQFNSVILEELINQVEIWIVEEQKLKPNETKNLESKLITPLQETRQWKESLLQTVARGVLQEFPFNLDCRRRVSQFLYDPHSSYAGNEILPYPNKLKTLSYRADYFLIGHSGSVTLKGKIDIDVKTVGWQKIGDYLSESNQKRRLGGAEAVTRTKTRLIGFLQTYVNADPKYFHTVEDLKTIAANRSGVDFKKQSPPTVVAATESSPAS